MRELFIYYRVRSGREAAALAVVRTCQSRLRADNNGLKTRLLRRAAEVGEAQTWMETYATDPAHAPDGVSVSLQQEIEQQAAALAPLLDGMPHTEVFTAVD